MSRAFDLATGTLTTDRGESFGPALTRADFLAGSLALGAEPLIRNDPYASWGLERRLDGRPFRLSLYFEGESLTMVLLGLDDPVFGTSWATWTLERELARKAAHEAWLASIDPSLGDDRTEPWGLISSIYDEKSGGSEIVIRFGAERRPIGPAAFRLVYSPVDSA